MDFQFWVWVIIIVITLIARANKKKQTGPQPNEEPTEPPSPTSTSKSPKGMTFEDLLKEIQGEKMRSKPAQVAPEPKKKYDYVDYDDDITDEIEDLEDVEFDASKDDEIRKTYEAAKLEAFNRPSLEETSNLGQVVRFDHFKEYARPRKRLRRGFGFLKDIKDPEGFRKAFIMSEILNRKY